MKGFVVLLLLLFAAASAYAQTPSPVVEPDLQIVKYSWSKERLNWEKDPFRSTRETFDEVRNRVNRERRVSSVLVERQNRADEVAKSAPPPPPRYGFIYKVTVVKSASKLIKEIDWDYVFTDTATGEELGRREFTSAEQIRPGKRKELVVFADSPPTNRISVYALGKRERDGLAERVVIVRVIYEDGATWQAQ